MPLSKGDKVKRAFGQEDLGELKPYTLRLYERDIETLKKYFHGKGLGLSTGIRNIVREFIQENIE